MIPNSSGAAAATAPAPVEVKSKAIAIDKSTRHQHILGKFGEYLVCNWLSRSGLEVSIIDHTGIDLIAFHPPTKHRLGISVKSRTRSPGTESESVSLFRKEDREKLSNACRAFGCEPWIAVYVECDTHADLYLTSLANYDLRHRKPGKTLDAWMMTRKHIQRYNSDKNLRHICISFEAANWWNGD